MALRIDLVFSYWMFFWYILYTLKFTIYSPKFIIGFGIIENIIMLLLMIYYKTRPITIMYFLTINFFIKIIPFYMMLNERIKISDIYATIVLFIIYSIWVYLNGETVIEYHNKIFESLIYDKNETPFISFMNYVQKYFENYKILYNKNII
jgi:hypothetical protein